MDISLPPDLEKLIRQQILEGHFPDGSSLVCEALEEWAHRHLGNQDRLRDSVARGLAEVDRGMTLHGEETLDQVMDKYRGEDLGETGS